MNSQSEFKPSMQRTHRGKGLRWRFGTHSRLCRQSRCCDRRFASQMRRLL